MLLSFTLAAACTQEVVSDTQFSGECGCVLDIIHHSAEVRGARALLA